MKTKLLIPLAAALGVVGLFLSACSHEAEHHDADVEYYTCSMHPSVKSQDPKGKCPVCGMNLIPGPKKSAATNAPATNASVEYYTCSMHPSVKSQDPKGKCPICGMDLIPGPKKGAATNAPATNAFLGHEEPSQFTVPLNRQQLIGVTYATVGKMPLRQSIRSVATVALDPQRQWTFVSRVDGYVQKLHVSSPGERVEKNQPLLTLYSADLLTTQREYLDALRMRDEAQKSGSTASLATAAKLIESASRRLTLWNIPPEQIAELEQTRQAKDNLTLGSPFPGVVRALAAEQGGRVAAGDRLVEVADLSLVWVWARFYQEDLPVLKPGAPVTITADSMPGKKFDGKIGLVDPFMNESSRTVRVRIDIPNPDFLLRPEMFVNATLDTDDGEALGVPSAAVLPTGERNLVFVDRGEGRLEPRFIELGGSYGGQFAVRKGLSEGELVVSSGNFLIDAESKIQGAIKTW
jgi:RND family efflux transporter MFP subunit